MKKVSETERFLIGWGKKDGRLCFFVSHKDLNKPSGSIPINPEDLVAHLELAIKTIELLRKAELRHEEHQEEIRENIETSMTQRKRV